MMLLLPLLRSTEILNKPEILEAFQDQQLKYLDQLVKWKNVPPDEKTLQSLKLNTLGQQLALQDLVEDAQRCRIQQLIHGICGPKRKKETAMGTNKVHKSKRNIQLGWLHSSKEEKGLTQVRLRQGGGSRNVSFSLSAGYDEVLQKACNLFFPSGKSSKGDLKDMMTSLAKFDQSEVERHMENRQPFTIKEYQRQTGLSVLRLYLVTRPKDTSDTDESDDSDIISLGPHIPNPDTSFDDTIRAGPQDASTPIFQVGELASPSVPQASADVPPVNYYSAGDDGDLMRFLEANSLPDMAPSTSTATHHDNHNKRHITVSRGNIFWHMISAFKAEDITDIDIKFSFLNERGVDTGGVSRDVYGTFWNELFEVSALGENERVPCVRSDMGVEHWTAVGRILVKGVKDTGFFPLRLSKAFTFSVLFGVDSVTPDILLASFNQYIASNEATLIDKALSDFQQLSEDDKDDLLDILQRFEVRSIPSTSSCLEEILFGVSHKELIQKPKYILDCLAHACKQLLHIDDFKSINNTQKYLDRLRPSVKKVIKLLTCSPENASQMTTHGYIKQFVNSMDNQKLGTFLRFCTGSDCLCFKQIDINFVNLSGAARRPVARTCGPILDVPCTYSNYAEFRAEFNSILSAEENWAMHYC